MMNCNISGEIPEVPCISAKSGLIFEKKLIEKYIKQYGKCPITNEELALDDIILINNNSKNNIIKPKPPAAASVPGALALLQNEWDSMMLEMFTLKQNLHRTRQELSRALYQHDAACRVIARLIKERDEARQFIGTIEHNTNNYNTNTTTANNNNNNNVNNNDNKMQIDDENTNNDDQNNKLNNNENFINEVVKQLRACAKELQAGRRQLVKSLQSKLSDINEFSNKISNHSPYDKREGTVIVTRDQLIVIGSDQGDIVLWQKNNKRKTIFLRKQDHQDEITSIQIHPKKDILYTSSKDKTLRIINFSFEDNTISSNILAEFNDEVVGCTLHPFGTYLAVITRNGMLSVYKTDTKERIMKQDTHLKATCIKFHPDGLILALGATNGNVHMFDITQQKNVFTFEGHKSNINNVDFSNNGYYFVTGDNDGVVNLWDLRKLEKKATHSIASPIKALAFDPSGTYLLISSDNLRTLLVKKWEVVSTIDDVKDKINSISFSSSLSYFAVLFNNAQIRIYSDNK